MSKQSEDTDLDLAVSFLEGVYQIAYDAAYAGAYEVAFSGALAGANDGSRDAVRDFVECKKTGDEEDEQTEE